MNIFKKKNESSAPIIGLVLALVPVFAFLIMSIYDSYVPYWIYQGIDRNLTYLLFLFVLISVISLVLGIRAITQDEKNFLGISTLTIDSITITFNTLLLVLINNKSINFNNYSFIYKLSAVINKSTSLITAFLALLFLVIGGYRIFKSRKKESGIILYILGVVLACLAFVGFNFVLLFL